MGEEKKEEGKGGPPFSERISKNLGGRYGFRDGRVEVDIDLPFPFSTIKKDVTISVSAEDFDKLYEILKKAKMWRDLPDFQRERDGAK